MGFLRLLLEADHAARFVDLDHAELPGGVGLYPQRADRQVGRVLDVVFDQPHVVHLVDVVAGQDHHVLRPFLFDGVDVLVDRVGSSLIPMLVDSLLGGDNIDELTQLAAEEPLPAHVDVAIEAHRLVLREHQHLADAAIERVGESEIDDSVTAAEGYGRLGTVTRQGFQPRALSPCQNHRQDVFHCQILLDAGHLG